MTEVGDGIECPRSEEERKTVEKMDQGEESKAIANEKTASRRTEKLDRMEKADPWSCLPLAVKSGLKLADDFRDVTLTSTSQTSIV